MRQCLTDGRERGATGRCFMKIKEILKCFLRQFDAENTVDYICGTEALPLPLSPEQESEMLGKLEQGEETDKVKAELIQHNLRLVVYIARKFDNTGVDPDDLISVGTIGLIKAIPLRRIKTSSWRPMLRDVSKTRFSCICAVPCG